MIDIHIEYIDMYIYPMLLKLLFIIGYHGIFFFFIDDITE